MQENEQIKEAIDNREELKRVAELREKAIRDEKNGLRHAREEGIREGKKEGREVGEKEAKIEIAKNLLKFGYTIEEIIAITELSKEDVLSIK